MPHRPRLTSETAFLLFALLVLVAAVWVLVTIDGRGYLINPQVQRRGVAIISVCEPQGPFQRCSARVTWSDQKTEIKTVRAAAPISGRVLVTAHESWQPSRFGGQPDVVVADGFPLKGSGKLIVIGITAAMVVVLLVARVTLRRLLPSRSTPAGHL